MLPLVYTLLHRQFHLIRELVLPSTCSHTHAFTGWVFMPHCYSADWVFSYAVCLVMEWKVKVKHHVDNIAL